MPISETEVRPLTGPVDLADDVATDVAVVVQAVRPQLPETVRDTMLADRPFMRMEAERLARRCQSQFVLVRVG